MKYFLLFLLFPAFMAGTCDNQQTGDAANKGSKDSLPVCIRKIVNAAGSQSPSDAPTAINEYMYKGKTVYLFSAPCCDQFNVLYDSNCQALCAPSGGFTGRGDNKCPDFRDSARFVKQVWKSGTK